MLTAKDAASFHASPAGGILAGSSWISFCVDQGLFGFTLRGTPSRDEMNALVHLLETELDRPPHAEIADVRGLSKRHLGETLTAWRARHR